MVVRFGQQQSRGLAGQSSIGGPKRNFANLYNMNRSGQQIDRKAASMQQGASATQQDMTDAIGAVKRPGGNTGQAQNSMANAVQRAKGISNEAQNFTPATQLMKSGAGAYQAGIGSFYAGGAQSKGATAVRKFSGLYQNVLGRQAQTLQDMNKATPASVVPGSQQPATSKFDQAQAANDKHNVSDGVKHSRGSQADQVNRLSDLDWALKTGRITNQQYYAAQDDDTLYDSIMKTING